MKRLLLLLVMVALMTPAAAGAQFLSFGLGVGTGVGERGGTSGGNHVNASLELKAPLLPGIRGDAYVTDAPSTEGKGAVALSAVISAPIPVVTPYLIAGWGTYGISGEKAQTGWNLGIGAKASIIIGPALFLEIRRHDKMTRDIVTVGLRF